MVRARDRRRASGPLNSTSEVPGVPSAGPSWIINPPLYAWRHGACPRSMHHPPSGGRPRDGGRQHGRSPKIESHRGLRCPRYVPTRPQLIPFTCLFDWTAAGAMPLRVSSDLMTGGPSSRPDCSIPIDQIETPAWYEGMGVGRRVAWVSWMGGGVSNLGLGALLDAQKPAIDRGRLIIKHGPDDAACVRFQFASGGRRSTAGSTSGLPDS